MAAKASKTAAVKKAPAGKARTQASKATAKKRSGPHLSAKQWKAYRAAAQKVMRQQQAEALRNRRLASAAKVTRKQGAALVQRRRLKVAQVAVRKTFFQVASSHQVAANRKRAARNVFRATQRATQARFVHEGISIHAHQVRMQTLTRKASQDAQARFTAAARRRAAASLKLKGEHKLLKKQAKAKAKKAKQPKRKAASRGYSPQAKAAGLRAAAALGPVNAPRKKAKRKAAKPKRKVAARKVAARQTQASVAQNNAKASVTAAASSKAGVPARGKASTGHAAPKARAAATMTGVRENNGWITAGNEAGTPNCVAVALANHLLAWNGESLDEYAIEALNTAGYNGTVTIPEALEYSKNGGTWPWRVKDWEPLGEHVPAGSLIGFESGAGPHATVLLPGNMVVAWGEEVPLWTDFVDEAYYVEWVKD